MKPDKKYWIWLSLVLGFASRNDGILSAFPNPEKLYNASENDRKIHGVFSKRQLEKFNEVDIGQAEKIIKDCEKNGWQIVTPDDLIYPAGLRKIVNMPLVLYVDGDISCLRGKVIVATVGTRHPCYESIAITRRISDDFVKAGAVVVSGGAMGIDAQAHEAAIESGGKTVCVLGSGLGVKYLRCNAALMQIIPENGAIVTEYPPFMPASARTFPERNRIISGMSHATLVIEAGEKSGSLITASSARTQGRSVFAIPGSIVNSAYTGANKLIANGEAKAATSAEDVLSSFAVIYPDRLNLSAIDTSPIVAEEETPEPDTKTVKKDTAGLDPDEVSVYNLFGDEPIHSDEIAALTGMATPKVLSILMQLRISGYIEQDENNNFKLTGE